MSGLIQGVRERLDRCRESECLSWSECLYDTVGAPLPRVWHQIELKLSSKNAFSARHQMQPLTIIYKFPSKLTTLRFTSNTRSNDDIYVIVCT